MLALPLLLLLALLLRLRLRPLLLLHLLLMVMRKGWSGRRLLQRCRLVVWQRRPGGVLLMIGRRRPRPLLLPWPGLIPLLRVLTRPGLLLLAVRQGPLRRRPRPGAPLLLSARHRSAPHRRLLLEMGQSLLDGTCDSGRAQIRERQSAGSTGTTVSTACKQCSLGERAQGPQVQAQCCSGGGGLPGPAQKVGGGPGGRWAGEGEAWEGPTS